MFNRNKSRQILVKLDTCLDKDGTALTRLTVGDRSAYVSPTEAKQMANSLLESISHIEILVREFHTALAQGETCENARETAIRHLKAQIGD